MDRPKAWATINAFEKSRPSAGLNRIRFKGFTDLASGHYRLSAPFSGAPLGSDNSPPKQRCLSSEEITLPHSLDFRHDGLE